MPDPKYGLKVAASVSKKLRSLDPPERCRLTKAILALAENPYPPGKKWKRLKGLHDQFGRLRVGDYRILYEVSGEEVHILAVVHRRDLEVATEISCKTSPDCHALACLGSLAAPSCHMMTTLSCPHAGFIDSAACVV